MYLFNVSIKLYCIEIGGSFISRREKLQRSDILASIGIKGGHLNGPPESPITSQHYGNEGFKGATQLGPPIMLRDASLYASRYGIFETGNKFLKKLNF